MQNKSKVGVGVGVADMARMDVGRIAVGLDMDVGGVGRCVSTGMCDIGVCGVSVSVGVGVAGVTPVDFVGGIMSAAIGVGDTYMCLCWVDKDGVGAMGVD